MYPESQQQRARLSNKYWRLIMQYRKSQEVIDRLTAEQRRVTQEAGTERPFTGEYNDHTEPGIYVDIVSGEPLFASSDKFESGCGWPSFTKPIVSANINELRGHLPWDDQ